jgi:hypothetical protein
MHAFCMQHQVIPLLISPLFQQFVRSPLPLFQQFVKDGHSFLMAMSFAKNFGLYGERVGTLSAVCSSAEEADRVMSQLKILVRPLYSNPPIYGARIVSTVLKGEWGVINFWGAKGSSVLGIVFLMGAQYP